MRLNVISQRFCLYLKLFIVKSCRVLESFRIFVASYRKRHMNRFLIRLFLVATLLCDFLGSSLDTKAQGMAVKDEQKSEEQIKQHDGYLKYVAEEPQSPVEVAFRSVSSSHRVASSRPTRLLPTHGGKPSKHHGRWAGDEVFKPFNCPIRQRCYSVDRLCTVAAPSRLYYVIALRRLLC